jgi:hypothetical protein
MNPNEPLDQVYTHPCGPCRVVPPYLGSRTQARLPKAGVAPSQGPLCPRLHPPLGIWEPASWLGGRRARRAGWPWLQPVASRCAPSPRQGGSPTWRTSPIKGEQTPPAFTLTSSSSRQPPRAMGAATGEQGCRSFLQVRS